MENWIQEVISKWKSEEVMLNPPATIVEIENTEAVLNFQFPADFRAFYLQANGFDAYEWQEHMFSFWSLNRIVEEFKYLENSDFIGFCDFLILSNCIGFRKSKMGIYKIFPSLKEEEQDEIAQNFEQVVNLINGNSGNIY